MKAVVTIQMDNQAFEQPYTCMELERVLYKIADTVARQAIDSVGMNVQKQTPTATTLRNLKLSKISLDYFLKNS